MKIGVLVKQVPDTWSDRRIDTATGRVDRAASPAVIDEICEYALEVALQLRASHGGEIVAIAMGPAEASEVLRRALEMGADEAVLVTDDSLAGADLTVTARVLASVLAAHSVDLVLTGSNSTDGRGGIVPAMVAEHLGMPFLGGMDDLDVTDGRVSGSRAADGGRQQLSADLPLVASSTERGPAPRVPGLRDVMKARKRKPVVTSLSDVGLADLEPLSTVVSAEERPARTAGPRVAFTPDAVREVIDLLVARRVV